MNNLRFITTCLQTCGSHNLSKLTARLSSYQSLHTTSISFQTSNPDDPPPHPQGKKRDKPVDWLPFQWERRPKFDIFTHSGDTIYENSIDPTLPKPDFELSDELKSASPEVKQLFSLATGSKGDMKEVCKRDLLKRIQRHPNDFDSLEVQIALMTIQVRGLFEHRKKYLSHDIRISKVTLGIIIQKRNKKLKQLRLIDEERFQWLMNELKMYFIPPQLIPQPEKYTKKRDLRRLTKEYCEKQIAEKKAAYHEELKKEQIAFSQEKKQALAWIEEEKKVIEAMRLKLM